MKLENVLLILSEISLQRQMETAPNFFFKFISRIRLEQLLWKVWRVKSGSKLVPASIDSSLFKPVLSNSSTVLANRLYR